MRQGPGGHARRSVVALFLLAVAGGIATMAEAATYPLKQSPNNRYLVDQDDVPYLMIGDSPQALIVNVTEAEAEMYFADRSSYGFNTLWVNLLCTTYTGGRPNGSTLDGIRPFTNTIPSTGSYDLETPNEAYFAHVDRILELAADHGLQVLLDPIETGGWLQTMFDNGTIRCRNYGRYLGSRYKNFDNIIWMSGNDFQGWRDPNNDAVVREVALGILDRDTSHLHTLELDYLVSSSLDDPRWDGIIGLNATYTYYPTYARLRQDYNRPSFLPTFMVEANYEFESLQGPVTTAPILRKQEYWTMTSGVTGQLYGNGYIWPFLNGWQEHLATPGAVQVGHLKTIFEPRAWYELVPDTSHVVVTAGYGTYASSGYVADNDYLTAARTPDGALVIVYTPIVRTFTVDMATLSAAATTRWCDPSSGAYVAVAGSPFPNSGTRDFTPPGDNSDGDGGWVLVLETEPVETQPPTVALTSPDAGAVVADTVQVSATADDNVGVVGVQFRVDETNLGREVLSPPYTVSWNTLTVANGAHVVQATARDLAGNRASDSVSVTVTNTVLPPPVDHLALAYAFDETEGTSTADASGNDNTGVLHGATFAEGRNGNALAFDGTSAYLEAANSASLDIDGTGLTIAFWVRIHATGSGMDYVIVGKPWYAATMTYPFYQYGVEYSNGWNRTLDFYFGDQPGNLHGPHRMNPTLEAWTHVAYTYDGHTVKGYLDGEERLVATDWSSLVARGHSLRMGVDGAYQQFFNGAVDDLRIYSRALTPAEIQSVMLTAVAGPAHVHGQTDVAPGGLVLSVEAPNPVRANAWISFALPATGEAELRIFDAAGRLVRALELGTRPAGVHRVEWDGIDTAGRAAPSGRYVLRLREGECETSSSLVLLR
jgi:hypothetical protein